MTAREYLSQAYRLDRRINSKLELVASLNALATKATVVLTGMPRKPNRATSGMADTIDKIIDLQAEIDRDIDDLVDLKKEIVAVVKGVESLEHQTLLEQRYLCFKSWEQIAVDMGYNLRHVYRLHDATLRMVKVPKRQSECEKEQFA